MISREKIEQVAREASALDVDARQRAALDKSVHEYAETFLGSLDQALGYIGVETNASAWALPIGDEPSDISGLLALIGKEIDTPGINCASGRHLGYIPPGGLYPSALGDYLAAVTNRYSGVSFASPGAAGLERALVEWIAGLVGYPEDAGGDLTSGGSIANLMSIVAAREAYELRATDLPKATIYLSAQTHHSLAKALRILGLNECVRREIPVDGRFRMDADALEAAIVADRAAGLLPWLIVGTAGSTDVGAVDPLAVIGDIAARHGCWYHIDAAYGGFLVLCDEGRCMLRGLEASQSIIMDPHKSLFLPFGLGAALVKDKSLLFKAHRYEASYMQDAQHPEQAPSPCDYSPELTRPFRGLRMWLPLKFFGLGPFRAALSEKLYLARYFYERIQEIPGFEVGPAPDLSIVAYRYVPKRGDADHFNARLTRSILADGRLFISTTRLNGQYMLRAAILNFRTHLDTIDLALDILAHEAKKLENEG